MKQVPIKLGPLALLLAVISICLTTLGILTFTTARADLRLAEKYASTVRTRYELERRGQEFLQELSETDPADYPILLAVLSMSAKSFRQTLPAEAQTLARLLEAMTMSVAVTLPEDMKRKAGGE